MQVETKINPIYFTDNYPRDGCRITITVPDGDKTGRCWSVRIQVPEDIEKAAGVPYLESYLASSLEGALIVAKCLAQGVPVPKHYDLIK